HRFLTDRMRDAEFMASHFSLAGPGPHADWPQGRRFLSTWGWRWQPLFGTDVAATCINPGMVMRREYVEKVLRFGNLDRLLATAMRSRLYGIEELVYSTLALAVDARPVTNPGGAGIRLTALGAADIRA